MHGHLNVNEMYTFVLSCKNTRNAGHIFMKFVISYFCSNLLTLGNFGNNDKKSSGICTWVSEHILRESG